MPFRATQPPLLPVDPHYQATEPEYTCAFRATYPHSKATEPVTEATASSGYITYL
nr:hypothetical protein Q903MT_gene84 [Picea sitchensis]